MWHWPQVSGSRASATEETWRAWQDVQVPIVPSLVGPADVVALAASLVHGRQPSILVSVVRRAVDGPLVDRLGERHLLGREVLLARDRRPGRRGVPALEVLLVLVGMAAHAVGRASASW